MKTPSFRDDISGRYASIRSRAGLTKKAFAESLGIHPVVSGDIELGKREPSRDVLVRLARAYGVDLTWLLTGETPEDDSDFSVSVSFIRQEAAAGHGVEISEAAEIQRLPVPRSLIGSRRSDRVRAVEVRGDSMTGIGLGDGDIVLFAPGEEGGDGVFVVSINTRLLVKRVHFDPAGTAVHLISENPSYPVRILTGPDLEDFRVEGRVIAWMHRA
ncbi:MAG TPA: LexA family transcriptional regulator [Treponemataceae bacterium]|nr:LexA family transcriptional regulator [Treponemataceae bacterium]